MATYTITTTIERTRYERQGPALTKVPVERWTEDCIVQITVSDPGVRALAETACRNKTGRSKAGPVIAKVQKRVRRP